MITCNFVLVKRVALVLLFYFSVLNSIAQQSLVSGTVRDSSGTILPGVTVSVKEISGRATSTDLNGRFAIDATSGLTLVFSLVGYQTTDVSLGTEKTLEVTLEPGNAIMDEVVVVGFGQQKKISSVGSQATVRPDELKLPVRNLNTALVGRLSGLIGVQRSGEPGNDNAEIFIRGIATLDRGLSQPLILVDGVERPMNDIDPEDIESFTMLKDASATAVYGVRGANGVIIITTKKGTPGKAKIRVRYTEGISTFTTVPELADGVTYMEMANEASTTRGGNPVYTQEKIDNTKAGNDPYLYPNVDWYDEVFNDWASNRNANVNITGGNAFVSYYLATGYYREDGILKTDALAQYDSKLKLDRYNFTSNLTVNPTSTTKIDLGIQGNITDRNLVGVQADDIFEQVMTIPPVFHALRYPDRLAGSTSTVVLNPYTSLTQRGYRKLWTNRLFSNLRLTQEIPFIEGLSATGMFSFDAFNSHRNDRTKNPDRWFATGRDEEGNLLYDRTFTGTQYLGFGTSSSGTRQYYVEAAINYAHTFGAHDVGGLILYNQKDYIETGGDLISSLPFRSRGIASRVNYAFKNRYLVEANFGYNGSENFDPDRRYGFFPSIGLGYNLSEESFFEPLKSTVQFLKLRFTHGLVGNSTIGGRRFAYIGTVANTTGYAFGRGQADLSYTGIDLDEYPVSVTWETAEKTNAGIEIRTLKNRLNLQVDLFREDREGIFLRRTSLPDYLGIRKEPYGNLGRVLNRGLDATLNYDQTFGEFTLAFQGNLTFARNRVLKNDDPPRAYPWLDAVGKKTTAVFGYVAEGIFNSQEEIDSSPVQVGDVRPGDLRFKDLNGDNRIDQYDRQAIGYGPYPEMIYGFGVTASYKNLTFGAFFQGAENVDIILGGEGFVPFQQGSERGNLLSNIRESWTEANPDPNAFYPRLSYGARNDNYTTNSWFMKDASYLRLKTLQVGYDLPNRWLKRTGAGGARLFFIGYNLLTFSDFKIWDVELGGGRGSQYPLMKTYSLGVDFNF